MHQRQTRILVADNDTAGRANLQRRMADSGYDVQFASTASDVIWHLHAGELDVLVLDVGLPGMDGFQLCECVRESPGGADTTIVVVAAAADEMTRTYLGQMVESAGGDYFFIKPYDTRLLAKVVDEAVWEQPVAVDRRVVGFPTRVVWPTSRCRVAML